MIMNDLDTMLGYMYVWGVSLVPPSPAPTHTHKRTSEEDLWLTRLKTKS